MTEPTPKPRANRRRKAQASNGRMGSPAVVETKLEEFRRRMKSVGTIVREVLGVSAVPDPEMRVHDAYLIVVSCIIEALVHGDERPSTSDLINFSKALAEQRRLDISRLEIERRFPEKVSSNDTLTATKDKPLPGGFSEVVEQIYGTNVTGV